MGLPVTARMDSAAPPRPSPSTRVLPGQRIGHQQNLVRICGALDLGRFRHHCLVESRAACGIKNDDIVTAKATRVERTQRDLRGLLTRHQRQGVDRDLLPQHGELLHGSGAAHIERGHEHLAPRLLGEALGNLGRRGRLARALQADHHDRHRRGCIEVDRLAARAQGVDQLVVHDLYHHLARRHRFDHFDADRLALHLVDEGAHHIECDVGFEKRPVHFAQRRIDVGLGQRTAPRQAVEDAAKPFGQ
jgi:hypothetical protein